LFEPQVSLHFAVLGGRVGTAVGGGGRGVLVGCGADVG